MFGVSLNWGYLGCGGCCQPSYAGIYPGMSINYSQNTSSQPNVNFNFIEQVNVCNRPRPHFDCYGPRPMPPVRYYRPTPVDSACESIAAAGFGFGLGYGLGSLLSAA